MANNNTTYDYLHSLLPYELQQDGYADNMKAVLKIYASYCDTGDSLSRRYAELLDIYSAQGSEVDFVGAMFGVFRNLTETDSSYRTRIIQTIQNRKTPTTLPDIQQAINAVVSDGDLYILENHRGKPCNVYLTGTADSTSISRALTIINSFLPAGVSVIVPVVSFERWQNIKDQFPTWESIGQDGYIW